MNLVVKLLPRYLTHITSLVMFRLHRARRGYPAIEVPGISA